MHKNYLTQLSAICRGDEAVVPCAIRGGGKGWIASSVMTIIIGCGAYGASVGLWRAPEQAAFLAVKLPALIFATILFNGILNGLLAHLLGSGLGFRQTFAAILMSFATFGAVLGALFPVAFFMAIGGPEFSEGDLNVYGRYVLIHTAVIAYAGLVANMQMLGTLMQVSERSAAIRTFFAWTLGNLFVGAQLAWNMRPFFGSPHSEIEFLREDAFEGSFYEAVFKTFLLQIGREGGGAVLMIVVTAAAAVGILFALGGVMKVGAIISNTNTKTDHDTRT